MKLLLVALTVMLALSMVNGQFRLKRVLQEEDEDEISVDGHDVVEQDEQPMVHRGEEDWPADAAPELLRPEPASSVPKATQPPLHLVDPKPVVPYPPPVYVTRGSPYRSLQNTV